MKTKKQSRKKTGKGKKAQKASMTWRIVGVGLTLAISIMSMLGAMSENVSPEKSSVMPVLGLLLPLFLAGSVLAMIVGVMRKSIWALMPLCAILMNIGYLRNVWSIGEEGGEEETDSIVVMSCKVMPDEDLTNRQYVDSLEMMGSRMKASVVCLQGYRGTGVMGRSFKEWKYRCVTDSVRGGMLVVSNYPIISKRELRDGEEIYAIMCDIVKGNDIIKIVNIDIEGGKERNNKYDKRHSGAKEHDSMTEKARQVDALCDSIRKVTHPMIVCGSLNTTVGSYAYKKLTKDVKDGFKERGNGLSATRKPRIMLMKEEGIYYKGDIAPQRVKYYWKAWNGSCIIEGTMK